MGNIVRSSIVARGLTAAFVACFMCACLGLSACATSSQSAAPSSQDQSASSQAEEASVAEPAVTDAPAESTDGVTSQSLQAALAPVATDTNMDVSITCIDLTTGATASIAGMNQMPASSLIKLAIAAAYFECEQVGQILRDEEHTIYDYEIVGENSVYKDMIGATVTMGDIVNKMLSYNDDTAANIIIERLGMYTINNSLQNLGFKNIQLTTRILAPNNARGTNDNAMTSDDVASLLQQVYQGSLVNAEASTFIMEALRAQQDASGGLAGLPEGTVFAHMPASSWNSRHDVGIVEAAYPYVLVVMCSQRNADIDDAAALDLITRAASAAQSVY